LAWNFRYYEKKRGHRRTGSRTLGSLGEAAFFAVLLVLGSAGILLGILWLVIPEWRVNHGFVQTTCVVEDAKLGQKPLQETDALTPATTLFRPEVKIEYQVHGKTYRPITYDIHTAYDQSNSYSSDRDEAEAALQAFVKGRQYPCWYDPGKPEVAVLVRGYQGWSWLLFLVPLSFVAIGAGGLIYTLSRWGKSAERRAARLQRAQPLDLFDLDRPGGLKLPSVPDPSDITSSPGTKLAYRLPLAYSPGWALLGLLAACVLWNGAVSYFAVAAVHSHLAGHPDWLRTLFILPFLAIGAALIFCFVRQLVVATAIGPTLLEISAHPLLPGGEYRLLLSQSGRLDLRLLEVALVCREEATYRQGTNTRTEDREVCRVEVFRREGFEIRGEPLEVECPVRVPAGAMHSFHADHNEIQWTLVVRGDLADWRPFQRSFPVIVHPGAAAAGPGSGRP
jgi:hypothetical protein